ncbi:MAG: response regulator, partial [Syntrophomonadaceae bacterium]|nr:response regulator [Syntrophomonadaceae bacterium]
MVVDDDENIRHLIKLLLQNEGFEVFSCADGKKALEQIGQTANPDLVITDIMM